MTLARKPAAALLATVLACVPPLCVANAPVDMARRTEELKSLRFGMFVCWSFSTFSGKEWTSGVKDLALFAAKDCDTDQWAATAKEAGMGYILFLAKHHDGFCLWDTATTDRKVTKAALGRDVLAELRRSCDKHGIKLALYFSEGDWTWPEAVDGAGRKGGNHPEMKKAQLKELLTNYGPIEYIWFDHAAGDGGLSHKDTIAWCKSLQPACFVGFNHGDQAGADIRLGERGRPGALDDHKAAGPHMRDAPAATYRLAEFTYPILPEHEGGANWFYSLPKHDNLCMPAERIFADYLGAVKFGNIFSLNVGPDYNGRLRDIDVRTLREVGAMIAAHDRNQAATPDFKDVNRVVFLGDSITQAGDYVADIDCWLVSQGRQVEILNLGLGSETASDLTAAENEGHLKKFGFGRPFVSERIGRVLSATKPDLVFACYGMNDASSLPADASGDKRYAEAITGLRETILKAGVKQVVLLTPPVRECKHGEWERNVHDQNLTRYTDWLLSMKANGWTVVDIHTPMRRALEAERAKNPDFGFTKDGVHPGREGHWVMARCVLGQFFGAGLDDVTGAERLFPADGEEIRRLVQQRMKVRFDAWMTRIGHTRPGVPGGPASQPGPSVEEAGAKAAALTERIRELRNQIP